MNPEFSIALALLLVAPFALAGLALQNAGLTRCRSAAHSLLGVLVLFAASAVFFLLIGSAWVGEAGGPAHIAKIAGYTWNWAGEAPWFGDALSGNSSLIVLLDLVLVGLAAMIPWGSGAERWRLSSAVASTVVVVGVLFPLFAHWLWAGGWLASLGTNFALGAGTLDTGGALPVHLLGGLSALGLVWTIGPRNGKFPKAQIATAIPGHNVTYVLFSCPLSLVGWLGINGAAALLLLHRPITALPLVLANTAICASAALLATLAITWIRFGKPDASLCANGWLGGLVASSAVAAHVSLPLAFITGALAGLLTPLSVEFLELALSIDDPSGGISVHAGNAVLGLLIVGLAGEKPGQLLAQIVGIATVAGLALPVGYLVNALLNRYLPYRVDPDGERVGLDVHELGAGAYPEFIIHRDEFQ